MRARTINEYGGAGFSYGGGSSMFPVNRGGQMNRGGFGGASNLGGPNMMYTYEIKALNRSLQPLILNIPEIETIKIGNDIKGFELNKKDGKLHVGILLRIEKSKNGSLKYYVILNPENNQEMKIDPTTALLVSKIDGKDPMANKKERERDKSKVDSPDWGELSGIYNESFYPQLHEAKYGVEYGEGEYGGPGAEVRLRTLALRTPLKFGHKFPSKTIQELLDDNKTGYLRWIYYNIAHMNFNDEILEKLGIIGKDADYRIEKPGTDPEKGQMLFDEKNKWREEQGKKFSAKRYNTKQQVYNPDKIKHEPIDFRKLADEEKRKRES
jgi:hypothetical protein